MFVEFVSAGFRIKSQLQGTKKAWTELCRTGEIIKIIFRHRIFIPQDSLMIFQTSVLLKTAYTYTKIYHAHLHLVVIFSAYFKYLDNYKSVLDIGAGRMNRSQTVKHPCIF